MSIESPPLPCPHHAGPRGGAAVDRDRVPLQQPRRRVGVERVDDIAVRRRGGEPSNDSGQLENDSNQKIDSN